MPASADIFLALRYLKPRRTFVSVITLLSVIGPIIGIALLIIVLGVMSGFDRDIRQRILALQAHLQILPAPSLDPQVIRDPEPILENLRAINAEGAPLIEGPVLIQQRQHVVPKFVKGILPEQEIRVTAVHENVRGRYDLREGEALLGRELARELNLDIGDKFLIHSPARLTRGLTWREDGQIEFEPTDEVYLPEEVEVVGIFSLGMLEFDASLLFIHIDQAADLFDLQWGSATSVHARVENPFVMTEPVRVLRQRLTNLRIISWQEANQQLFGALHVEKNLMSFLLACIVVVASFGIAGTLITVVVQKTHEIGILKAVGMSNGMVARIFVLQAMIIAIIGNLLGTLLGIVILHNRNLLAGLLGRIFGFEVFPQQLYHLEQIPAYIKVNEVVGINILAFVICLAAALIPAWHASRMIPAEALQEE